MSGDERERVAGSRVTRPPPDPEALLCALVLAPHAWSRNRFFHMFEDPRARRARRRASQVRSLITTLRQRGGDLAEVLPLCAEETGTVETGDVEVRFEVPSLGLARVARVSQLELALVRYALHVGSAEEQAVDRQRVERALGRLL